MPLFISYIMYYSILSIYLLHILTSMNLPWFSSLPFLSFHPSNAFPLHSFLAYVAILCRFLTVSNRPLTHHRNPILFCPLPLPSPTPFLFRGLSVAFPPFWFYLSTNFQELKVFAISVFCYGSYVHSRYPFYHCYVLFIIPSMFYYSITTFPLIPLPTGFAAFVFRQFVVVFSLRLSARCVFTVTACRDQPWPEDLTNMTIAFTAVPANSLMISVRQGLQYLRFYSLVFGELTINSCLICFIFFAFLSFFLIFLSVFYSPFFPTFIFPIIYISTLTCFSSPFIFIFYFHNFIMIHPPLSPHYSQLFTHLQYPLHIPYFISYYLP